MANWRTRTLGDICEESGGGIQTGPFGSQLHAEDYVERGTPSVMPKNIGDNRIDVADIARVSDEDVARLARYRLAKGDIVYSRRGDVERRALVRLENEGWLCGTGCLRVRIGDDRLASPEFVSYALGTDSARSWIRRHAVGATMLNLNTGILSAVPLRVPGIETQRAIAEVLGALDDKIAANERAGSLIQDLADANFQRVAATVPQSGDTFEDVANIGGGGTPKTAIPEYWGGEVLWATPTDVTALRAPYLSTTARMLSEEGLDACSSAKYPKGSILMTSRATIGAFAIAAEPMAVNQGFIVVNAKDPMLQWWLFHEMRSRVPEFLSHANGATFMELSRGKFKQLLVRIPPSDVAGRFSKSADALHGLAGKLSNESEVLARTRDELLPLLMSGKLRIRDAEKKVEEIG